MSEEVIDALVLAARYDMAGLLPLAAGGSRASRLTGLSVLP